LGRFGWGGEGGGEAAAIGEEGFYKVRVWVRIGKGWPRNPIVGECVLQCCKEMPSCFLRERKSDKCKENKIVRTILFFQLFGLKRVHF
jgi:hypothetical protein